MKLKIGFLLMVNAFVAFQSCTDAVSYTTTADRSLLFKEQKLSGKRDMGAKVLVVDPSETYQTIDGFGAAITGASCYNLLKMSAEDRHDVLMELFDVKDGLGISLIRVSIGASDFSVDEEFTWCDEEGLENFRVAREDEEYLFPVLKEIYAINPDVKIVASPWSCPRWMKRRSVEDDTPYNSWTSGSLRPECYDDYAKYFVLWIETMESMGFDIYAMTIQNEPLNHGNSMSLYMTWQEQLEFIKRSLGPAFRDAGIDTKILLFDHNYNYDGIADQQEYALNILADADAAQYIAGSAWHNYNGHYSELEKMQQRAPEKDIYFTEASIGTWNYNFPKSLLKDFNEIFVQTLKRGNKGVTLWNMMLDEDRRPFRPGGCGTCYGVLTLGVDSATVVDRTSHYYDIAHASKVIRPGAVRIGISETGFDGVDCVAFRNPDGTYATLFVSMNEYRCVFQLGKGGPRVDVPAQSIVSVLWK